MGPELNTITGEHKAKVLSSELASFPVFPDVVVADGKLRP